ncbi:MAG: ABC transporter ATP-binding protein [bacterium]|nr:ABC transporter ATP-binding protein [bacterium]
MKVRKLAGKYFFGIAFSSSLLIVVGNILKVALVVIIPLLTKHILDIVLPSKDYLLLTKWAIAILAAQVCLIGISIFDTYMANCLKYGFGNYLKSILLGRIINSNWKELSQKGSGYLTGRIEGDLEGVNTFFIDDMLNLTKDAITLVVSVIIIAKFNLTLSLVFFSILPIFAISLKLFNRGMNQRTIKMLEKKANNTFYLNEIISGRLEIKYLGAEKEIISRYAKKLTELFNIAIERFVYSCKPSVLGQLSSTLGKVVLIWLGGYLIIKGELTFGSFFAFNMLMVQVFSSTSGLTNLNISLQTGKSCIKRVQELFSIEQEKKEGIDIESIETLNVKEVCFSYSEKDDFGLKNVSFSAKKGEIIALVGESGAGKTTIFKLLQRVYMPEKGEISANGININSISLDSYRNKIAIVQQAPFLFLATIKENISMGKLNSTDEEIDTVLKRAQAMEFINQLEDGLNHKLNESGGNLSGGQKQRLAIARAFLKKPDVLLLDEATAGLDANNIKAIHNVLIDGKDDRITIVISHSKETMLLADRTIVLDKGNFVTSGTHRELIQTNILYQHLFQTIENEG